MEKIKLCGTIEKNKYIIDKKDELKLIRRDLKSMDEEIQDYIDKSNLLKQKRHLLQMKQRKLQYEMENISKCSLDDNWDGIRRSSICR